MSTDLVPTAAELDQEVSPIVEKAHALVVNDASSHSMALTLIAICRHAHKEIKAKTEPMREKAYAAYKATLDFQKRYLGPLETADTILTERAGAWHAQQEEDWEEVERKEGISFRKIWHAEVYDKEMLVRWCLDNNQLYLLEPNLTALNQRARNEHDELDIPGVKAASEVSYAVR